MLFITLTLYHENVLIVINCDQIKSYYRCNDEDYTMVSFNKHWESVKETPDQITALLREAYVTVKNPLTSTKDTVS